MSNSIDWQWCVLDDLTAVQLYKVCAAREAVFVVEQECAYQELDGMDFRADHLIGWSQGEVAAYLRVLGPGTRFKEPSIGRVLTSTEFRGSGLGNVMIEQAVRHIEMRYPGQPTRLGAQAHLQRFYGAHGFVTVSGIYIEDDIPHVEMLRS